jgi:uroporphyrin-3 C-methyltransferase
MKDSVMENTAPIAPEKAPIKAKSPKRFVLAISVLFILLIAAVVFLWQELQKTEENLNKIQKHFSTLSTQQKTNEDNFKNQLAQTSQKLDAQQNILTQANTQLAELMKRASGDDRSWRVGEIVYLVRMANLLLNVQHDIPKALVLLKKAENRVTQLHDAALDSFHAALLKNISALQNTPIIDIDGLTTQLSNLRDQVPALSILVAPKPNMTILENTEREAHKKWWQHAWNNIKASLQQLVIVRREEEKMPAIIAPEEQLYLQENLQLLLMQAQWALINHDQMLYQKSLKQANSWVEKYYVQNSASTQNFLKQLQALLNQNISPPVPDFSPMLASLHEAEM